MTFFDNQDRALHAQHDTMGGRTSFAREAMGSSVDQMAEALGVDGACWQSWEDDRDEPRANHVAMMAGLLSVSPSWLLTGSGTGPVLRDSSSATEDVLQELKSASVDAALAQKRVAHLLRRLDSLNALRD